MVEPAVSEAPVRAPAAAPARVRVETDRLTAMYGRFTAVKSVSLAFDSNRVHALIGPSGCGKSTYLRALNRMHELSENGWITGRVLLDGTDIYGPKVNAMQLRRRIGMVFQRPTPFPTMSIYDNVAAGLRVHGRLSRRDLDSVVEGRVKELLQAGPRAVAEAKALIREVAWRRVEDVQRYTVERIAEIRTTAEGQEGMRAFLEKRKPSWITDRTP